MSSLQQTKHHLMRDNDLERQWLSLLPFYVLPRRLRLWEVEFLSRFTSLAKKWSQDLMADSLLFVTAPFHMKGYSTDWVGRGGVISLSSLDLRVVSPADRVLENPSTLCGCTTSLGRWGVIVLSSQAWVGGSLTCRQNWQTHPDPQLYNITLPHSPSCTPITLCRNPKASKRAWFYGQKQLHCGCSGMTPPVSLPGAGGTAEDGWWVAAFEVARYWVQAPLNGLCTEKVCQARLLSAWEWRQESWDREEAFLLSCPPVPRKRPIVPNYFLRVFMSSSHMPFGFRSTKQIEMGFQTWSF